MTYQAVASSDDWDEWLIARSSSVTATDIARLASGGPAVWATIRAEKQGHRSFHGNKYTEWGKAREPVIAAGSAVRALNMLHNTTFYVRDGTNIGATPDLITRDDSLVGDIKTAKLPENGEWTMPPQKYIDQCLIQMWVMGAEGAALVVEFHEDFRPVSLEPRVYWVDYNQDRLDYLLDLAEQFVEEGPGTVMDGLLARRVEAMRAKTEAVEEIAAVDAEIMQLIGDRDEFKHVSDLGTITLSRPAPRETFQLSKFKESYPDLVQQFTVPGRAPKPSLRVTPAKETE